MEDFKLENPFRLFDNMLEGITVYKLIFNDKKEIIDAEIEYINREITKLMKDKPEDVIGKKISKVMDSDYIKPYLEAINEYFDTGKFKKFEFYYPPKDKYLIISGFEIFDDYFATLSTDITEVKKVKEELLESTQRFQIMANGTPGLIWVTDSEGKHQFVNKTYLDYFQVSEEEVSGHKWQPLIHPEDKPEYLRKVSEAINEKKPFLQEIRVQRGDGKWRWLETSAMPRFSSNNEYLGHIGLSIDVNKCKKAKKELKKSKDIFKNFFSRIPDYAYIVSPEGKIIDINGAAIQKLGYEKQELINKPLSVIYAPESQSRMNKLFAKWKKTGELRNEEMIVITKTGEKRKVLLNAGAVKDKNGKILNSVSLQTDITELKNAQIDLEKSETYYKTIFENTGTATIIIEDDNTIILVNSEAEKLSKCPKKELEGKRKWTDFVEDKDDLEIMERYHELRNTNSGEAPRNYEFKLKDNEGITKDIYLTVAPIPGSKKRVVSLLDITEKKTGRKALQNSERRFKIAMDLAKLVSWEYDYESDMFTFDDQFYALYGTTVEKEGGTKMSAQEYASKFVPPDESHLVAAEIAKSLETDDPNFVENIEHTIIRADGEKRFVLVRFGIIKDDEGRTIKAYGANQDITERKLSENQIKESLKEKEILLREIHHRVKNNLQIISSLLNLQKELVEEEESIDVLTESSNRIRTMALIHEELYRSPSLKNIKFKDFIDRLISSLIFSYGVNWQNIKIISNIDDLTVGMDTAIPCGLIINELVTNSLKYAFQDNKGVITVSLKKISNKYNLIISDNGIGIPGNVELENTDTLGFNIVNSLVAQLEGSIELKINNGTEFKIIFEELEYKERF